MTLRQKEFCRHYLRGLTATAAARAAGYAAATAEKNAATILAAPGIAAYIAYRQSLSRLVTPAQLAAAVTRLNQIILFGADKDSIAATKALLKLKQFEPNIAADTNYIPVTNPSETPQQETNQINTQMPDNQLNQIIIDVPQTDITEVDTLPTGEPAFDLRLAPLHPKFATPRRSLSVTLNPLTKNPKSHP
jgi:phage terminase small subunit